MNKLLIVLLTIITLTGCQNSQFLEDSIGVGEDDNAFMCVTINVPGRYTGSTVRAKRVEFPSEFNVTELTASQLEQLEDKFCD